jgi:hypothetical protein
MWIGGETIGQIHGCYTRPPSPAGVWGRRLGRTSGTARALGLLLYCWRSNRSRLFWEVLHEDRMNDCSCLVEKRVVAICLPSKRSSNEGVGHLGCGFECEPRLRGVLQLEPFRENSQRFVRDAGIKRRGTCGGSQVKDIAYPQGPETRLRAEGINKYVEARSKRCCPGGVFLVDKFPTKAL